MSPSPFTDRFGGLFLCKRRTGPSSETTKLLTKPLFTSTIILEITSFKDLEKAYGTVLTTFIGYSDNMALIIKESLKGARFIDIGFDATRTIKGLKGMDLFTEIASRVTINSERFFAQLFRKKNDFRYFRHKIF